MIVRLATEGVVVQDADDCSALQVSTELDEAGVHAALAGTGTGELLDSDTVLLDLAVLRSRAQLVATEPDWARRWAQLARQAERTGRLSEDGRSVQVRIER